MSAPAALPEVPATFSGGLLVLDYLQRLKAWVDYLSETSVSRTATADGTTTGTISTNAQRVFVTVTSDDANKIIILPEPIVNREVVLHNGATGYELRSSSPTTVGINGGTGADAESAIPANSTILLKCVSATAWKGFFMDADGDLAKVEAAA